MMMPTKQELMQMGLSGEDVRKLIQYLMTGGASRTDDKLQRLISLLGRTSQEGVPPQQPNTGMSMNMARPVPPQMAGSVPPGPAMPVMPPRAMMPSGEIPIPGRKPMNPTLGAGPGHRQYLAGRATGARNMYSGPLSTPPMPPLPGQKPMPPQAMPSPPVSIPTRSVGGQVQPKVPGVPTMPPMPKVKPRRGGGILDEIARRLIGPARTREIVGVTDAYGNRLNDYGGE